MVDESDDMVDVWVAASGRASFEYTFTIAPMDLTATSQLDSVFNKYKLDGDYNSVSTEVGWWERIVEVSLTIERSLPPFHADNVDYTFPPTLYTFGHTDDNEPIPSLVISIPINDDNNNEMNEHFKLTLKVSAEDEAANVTEGPISMTVVLIKDDDGKTKGIQY